MQSTQQRRAFHIAPDQDKEKVMSSKFVPVDAVADRFGMSVHTVRGWVRRGLVPDELYVKIGNTYRYDVDGLEGHFLGPKNQEVSKEEVKEVVKEESGDFVFDPDALDEDF